MAPTATWRTLAQILTARPIWPVAIARVFAAPRAGAKAISRIGLRPVAITAALAAIRRPSPSTTSTPSVPRAARAGPAPRSAARPSPPAACARPAARRRPPAFPSRPLASPRSGRRHRPSCAAGRRPARGFCRHCRRPSTRRSGDRGSIAAGRAGRDTSAKEMPAIGRPFSSARWPSFRAMASAAIRAVVRSCRARSAAELGPSRWSAPSRYQRRSVKGARGRSAMPCRRQRSRIRACQGVIQAPPNSSMSPPPAKGRA